MGTTLTGTTPANTYDSLIKVTDNGPLSGTAKYLSDGLGNDSALALSTSAIAIGTNTALAARLVTAQGRVAISNASGANDSQLAFYADGTTNGIYSTYNSTGSYLPMAFYTSDVERMRIDSAGNVGIGTSSPTSYYSNKLVVYAAGENGITIANTATTGSNYLMFADGTTGDERYRGFIEYAHTGDYMALATSGAEKIRITSTGNVGIGTSSPATKLDVALPSDGTAGVIFGYTGGSNNPRLFFNVNESTSKGQIILSGSSGALDFGLGAGGAEIITLKGSGNVGIGTTSPSEKLVVSGGALQVSGVLSSLDRPSSSVIDFLGGTARIFSIGADSSTHGSISFSTSTTTTNLERAVITTGGYFRLTANSGGIQFNGDTAAANALDDYEEGTWTPVIVGTTTSGTGTYQQQLGKYTKIGNVVRVHFSVQWSAHTGTGNTAITGLPFASGAGAQTPFSVFTYGVTMSAGNVPNGGILSNGTTTWLFWQIPTGGGNSSGVPIYNGSAEIQVSGTYQV